MQPASADSPHLHALRTQFDIKLADHIKKLAAPIAPPQGAEPTAYEHAAHALFEAYAQAAARGEADPTMDWDVRRAAAHLRNELGHALAPLRIGSAPALIDAIHVTLLDTLQDLFPAKETATSASNAKLEAKQIFQHSLERHAPAMVERQDPREMSDVDYAVERLAQAYFSSADQSHDGLFECSELANDPHLVALYVAEQERHLRSVLSASFRRKAIPEEAIEPIMADVVNALRRLYPQATRLPTSQANDLLMAGLDAWEAFDRDDGDMRFKTGFESSFAQAYPKSYKALQELAFATDQATHQPRTHISYHAEICADALLDAMDEEIGPKSFLLVDDIQRAFSRTLEAHRANFLVPTIRRATVPGEEVPTARQATAALYHTALASLASHASWYDLADGLPVNVGHALGVLAEEYDRAFRTQPALRAKPHIAGDPHLVAQNVVKAEDRLYDAINDAYRSLTSEEKRANPTSESTIHIVRDVVNQARRLYPGVATLPDHQFNELHLAALDAWRTAMQPYAAQLGVDLSSDTALPNLMPNTHLALQDLLCSYTDATIPRQRNSAVFQLNIRKLPLEATMKQDLARLLPQADPRPSALNILEDICDAVQTKQRQQLDIQNGSLDITTNPPRTRERGES